ncbi:MAG: hypothetical protein HYV41_02635 [Candidatus Magasanikbacteria bacterium]|nr:hypothetical protein [Candidatus Magasanikbacteria bacterium]
MHKKRTEIIQKGDLKITVIYTGNEVVYGYAYADSHVMSDDDYGDDDMVEKEGPEVEDILIENKTGTIHLSDLLPNKLKDCRFVGPVDCGDGYKESERVITFGDLHIDGSILGILHEVGHVWINERYHSDGSLNYKKKMAKYERHAWGHALSLFNQFKRDGLNLEPNFDAQGIKKFIKESLLSHEIDHRYDEYFSSEGDIKNTDMEFWTGGVSEEEIDDMIKEFLKNDLNSEASLAISKSFRK